MELVDRKCCEPFGSDAQSNYAEHSFFKSTFKYNERIQRTKSLKQRSDHVRVAGESVNDITLEVKESRKLDKTVRGIGGNGNQAVNTTSSNQNWIQETPLGTSQNIHENLPSK